MVDGLQTESESETHFMGLALSLARRAYGQTSPNPMVGAVLVKNGKIIGQGWHRRAGKPHAEIEALRDAQNKANDPKDATLYVTLEPCSTRGRTPPCTDAIVAAGIQRVVAAATDPNPLMPAAPLVSCVAPALELLTVCSQKKQCDSTKRSIIG
jgi:diaminohydroxyphosphoribosylaminopyrimidine deaminase/5-amino-6-(5-phosphoribosylamino)uracil reductase